MKTLKETCEIIGLTRRAIQEYEKAGVAHKATGSNKYNHLLYGDKELRRLCQIRFYRELGYDKEQMKKIFEDPNYNRDRIVKEPIQKLEAKKRELEQLIEVAKGMEELGIGPEDVCFGIPGYDDIPYNIVFSMLYEVFRMSQSLNDDGECLDDVITGDDENILNESIEKLCEYCDMGIAIECEQVQVSVFNIHDVISNWSTKSIYVFSWFNVLLFSEGGILSDIDDTYGEGKRKYIYDAVYYYCEKNKYSDVDKEVGDALHNIICLGRKKYAPASKEVQEEVRHLHNFYSQMKIVDSDTQLQLLANLGQLFGTNAYGGGLIV